VESSADPFRSRDATGTCGRESAGQYVGCEDRSAVAGDKENEVFEFVGWGGPCRGGGGKMLMAECEE